MKSGSVNVPFISTNQGAATAVSAEVPRSGSYCGTIPPVACSGSYGGNWVVGGGGVTL